jgi:STE24 endopeptidase
MLNAVGTVFLILFCIALSWDATLIWLNLRRVQQVGAALPEVFQVCIDLETYKKSVAYNRDSERFGLIQEVTGGVLLIILIYFGGFEAVDNLVRSFAPQGYYTPALFFAALLFIIKFIIGLPFNLYDTFVLEARYGFNRITPRLFVVDAIKSLLLTAAIGIPLYVGILWFMTGTGTYWWIWAWFFLESSQIFLIVFYPAWIAPLFNKFTPLEEGALREGITDLAKKTSFPIEKIVIMDGSRRSSHSNAFFASLGRKKRIVLFDTLLRQMDIPKILSVLAHEIGHYKLNHIKKRNVPF